MIFKRVSNLRRKRTLKKGIIGLKSYREYSHAKRAAIDSAFAERKRFDLIKKFMKVALVA
jgi:hypothetical protein